MRNGVGRPEEQGPKENRDGAPEHARKDRFSGRNFLYPVPAGERNRDCSQNSIGWERSQFGGNRMKRENKLKIKVLLVDDHPLVLEGVRSSLLKHDRFEIVGEACSGPEAIDRARKF